MATSVYKNAIIYLIDGTEIEISPLKIKYFRDFMQTYNLMEIVKEEEEIFKILLECGRICFKQFAPYIKTVEDLEDNIDLDNLYKLLEVAGGIKFNKESEEESNKPNSNDGKQETWDTLDLAKLEKEVFLIGAWKNFEDLETSLSMGELVEIISSKRELTYEERKFSAALQGVDLDKENGKGQKEWEDLKARVFSKGKAKDSDDIVALQGQNAINAGFGIGMGLDYEDLR